MQQTCGQWRADASPWARAITHNPLLSNCKHMQKDKHGLRLNSSMSPSVCVPVLYSISESCRRVKGSWWWNFKGQVLRADASLRIKHHHGSHEARVYAFTSTLSSWTNRQAVDLTRTRVCLWINKIQSVWQQIWITTNHDKPWFTAKLRQLCQAKEDAYRKGDKVLYKQAKYTVEKEIRVAKRNYSGKLGNKFSSSDSASVWKGMKDITSYKTPSPSTLENQQLADDLNEFYCRFEKTPFTPPATPLSPTPALQIREDDVCQVFKKNKRRKAPGPDGVSPACPKSFASWGSSTCHRSCWNSSTLPSLNPSSAHQ